MLASLARKQDISFSLCFCLWIKKCPFKSKSDATAGWLLFNKSGRAKADKKVQNWLKSSRIPGGFLCISPIFQGIF